MLLGYVFRREEYPLDPVVGVRIHRRSHRLARGLEFATQPFDVPRREVIQTNAMFDDADLPLASGEIDASALRS